MSSSDYRDDYVATLKALRPADRKAMLYLEHLAREAREANVSLSNAEIKNILAQNAALNSRIATLEARVDDQKKAIDGVRSFAHGVKERFEDFVIELATRRGEAKDAVKKLAGIEDEMKPIEKPKTVSVAYDDKAKILDFHGPDESKVIQFLSGYSDQKANRAFKMGDFRTAFPLFYQAVLEDTRFGYIESAGGIIAMYAMLMGADMTKLSVVMEDVLRPGKMPNDANVVVKLISECIPEESLNKSARVHNADAIKAPGGHTNVSLSNSVFSTGKTIYKEDLNTDQIAKMSMMVASGQVKIFTDETGYLHYILTDEGRKRLNIPKDSDTFETREILENTKSLPVWLVNRLVQDMWWGRIELTLMEMEADGTAKRIGTDADGYTIWKSEKPADKFGERIEKHSWPISRTAIKAGTEFLDSIKYPKLTHLYEYMISKAEKNVELNAETDAGKARTDKEVEELFMDDVGKTLDALDKDQSLIRSAAIHHMDIAPKDLQEGMSEEADKVVRWLFMRFGMDEQDANTEPHPYALGNEEIIKRCRISLKERMTQIQIDVKAGKFPPGEVKLDQ